VRTVIRRGDHAQLARVSFVDDLNSAPVAKQAKTEKVAVKSKTVAPKKPVAKKEAK
jgi:hypothetical protein